MEIISIHEISEKSLFKLFNSASVISTHFIDNNLSIECLEPFSAKEQKFIVLLESVKEIFENGEQINIFNILLQEGEIINYAVTLNSLELVINWSDYHSKQSCIAVYLFRAKVIGLIMDQLSL